ncbi:putative repeat protein (TIGR01451 family)/LPXTG-motif cell wall-anchored protein [Crossiella equi]|uniref:Repeat protein (TIGR01451 family)/LPXTG-motif cell wall-anchored protein n=1 Tax=Crossiella equi TaxID=130796 RepID=A0ABS5AGM7_9PSEU|nr:LPXTG cell wall anchor domain-containing protein [Crossiella equi]MBP2475726.1 putative repeat protein (TIGR01451 family)/LPXTG-motif cell wall-anchored protein [Crossiella equi]
MRLLRVLLALLLALGALLAGVPAQAGVVNAFTLNYDQVVYGDFLEVGNGSLRCPTAADRPPLYGSATVDKCATTATGATVTGDGNYNDDFYMLQADVDGDAATFNSSRATLRVPPGATVDFARLNWAGNTGRFPGTTALRCGARGSAAAVVPSGAAATPAQQPVTFTVGDKAQRVSAVAVTEDPAGTYAGSGQYYSAYADVTSAFAGAATGTDLTVTAANVWGVSGFGCMAGWSLVVVYKYAERDPVHAPSKREVFVYDGHVRQNSSDPETTVTVRGFRSTAATTRIGVTAYEGDRNITGDAFKVNRTAIAEPGTRRTDNFFISLADGRSEPGAVNNWSVDAKSFETTAIPVGATSADLAFSTNGDSYLAQNLVFSVAVPELQIDKVADPATAHEGDQITYTIRVTNPSGAPARDVRVSDPRFPACDRVFGTLAGGRSETYTCTAPAPADDVTNTAKVTGTSSLGDALDGTSSATVDVIHPAITLTKQADKPAYRVGDQVVFTMTVTNSGDVPLTALRVEDPKVPDCARNLPGVLAPGERRAFTCTTTAPVQDDVNSATASGADRLGKRVTDAAEAPVPIVRPGIELTKTADPTTVRAGDEVTFTLTVRNTGDSPLDPVRIEDSRTPACARTLPGPLAAGASQTHTCTARLTETTTNTATATGRDGSGQDVTASAQATVTVLKPGVAIEKSATPQVVRAGEEVTFTIRVTNTGDSELTGVTVTDPKVPACDRVLDRLAPGASRELSCRAPVTEDQVNTATVTGTPPVGPPVTASDDASVDVVRPAVEITKTASPETVREGDEVTFTVEVRNTGDVPLTRVAVADPVLPACARTLPDLAPGARESYSCTWTAGATDLVNTATVTGTDPTGRQVTASDDAAVDVVHPGIEVTKTASPESVREGDAVTFTVVVKNSGDVPLREVVVTDPAAPGCATTIAELAAGAERRISCTVTAGAQDLVNTASATGKPPVGPPVTDDGTATVRVLNPGINITKEVRGGPFREGDPVTFTITVVNAGDSALTDVVVADPVAPGCARVFDSLAAGASQRYECTMAAPADDVVNTATVTGKPPVGPPVTDADDAAVDVVHPGIEVTKTASPDTVRPGDAVTFTVVVRNSGDTELTRVVVTDPEVPACDRVVDRLAAGEELRYQCTWTATGDLVNTVAATGEPPVGPPVRDDGSARVDVQNPGVEIIKDVEGGPFRAGDAVTFRIAVRNTGDVPLRAVEVRDPVAPECARTFPELAVGAREVYPCTMTAPAEDVVNTAIVTGKPPTGPDVSDVDDAPVDVVNPGITVEKSVSPATARPGDEVTYTIVVRNAGDVPLTDVRVTDDREPRCGFTLPVLAAGASVERTCVVTAAQDVTNTATATGTDPTGRPVTDTDDAVLDVIGPGLRVVKTGPAKPLLSGQEAQFTVVVTNTGDVPLTGVVLSDPVAPGCSVTVGDLAPGQSSQPVRCAVTMREGDVVNTVRATGTDPTGRPVTDTDTATAVLGRAGIDLVKTADQEEAAPGRTVTWKLTVRNTGNVDLVPVVVDDPASSKCSRAFDRLRANETQTWTCTGIAPSSGTLVNTATATGQPDTAEPSGPVTDTDSASVRVPGPGPGPTPPLAKTGASPAVFLWAGLAMVLVGLVAVFGARRRRS